MNDFAWEADTPIQEVIGNAMGAASMCWTPVPAGVFDSERASDLMKQVLSWLDENYTMVRK